MGFNSPPNTHSEQEPPEKFLKAGDSVNVLRSDGREEGGWVINRFDQQTGDAVVSKNEANQALEKRIPQIELYALNEGTKKFSRAAWVNYYSSVGVVVSYGKANLDKKELTAEEARKFGEKQVFMSGKETDEERQRMEQRRRALLGF